MSKNNEEKGFDGRGFYEDELFGKFRLDKEINLFEADITWGGEEGRLYFELGEEEEMKDALKTAHELFKNQEAWNEKIKVYAASSLVEAANEWIDEYGDIDEVTEEIFIKALELESINVYPKGEFEIYFFDGDLFAGHGVVVRGNIDGNFDSAEMA